MSNGPLSSASCSLMDASEAAAGDGAGGAAGGGAPVDVIEVPSSSAGGAVSGSQRPDSAPSLPDLGIPVRQALHHLPEVTCGDAPLSFRRFLASSQQQQQLQLAVSPSLSQSLSPAVVSSTGSACRPDVAAGLPDFVRDDPHEQQQQLATGAAAGGVASEAAVATLSGDRQRPAALCVARSSQVRLSARVAPTPVRQPPSVGRQAPLDRPCTAASSASNTASPPPSSSSCSSFSSAALSCQQQQLPSPSSQPNAALSGRAGLPDFLSNTTSASAASSASASAAAASDGGGGCMAAAGADLTAERHSVSLLAQRVTQLEQENTDLRCSLSRLRRQLTAELERSADLESRLRGVDTASLSPAAPTAAAAAAGGSGVPVCHQPVSSSRENAAVAHLMLTANQSESLISELRESVRALRDAATLLQQHAPSDTSNNNSNNQQPPTPQQ